MSTRNPIAVQQQVRENASDVQAFLTDLSSWSTHMKAKELAESGDDLQPMDKVPPRNDPKKQTKEKENRTTKSEMMPAKGDYSKWEKFDVEKACADVDKDEKKEEETEEQKLKRMAITLRLKTVANEKKEKGNQFLKEKKYEEAIESYSEGIRADKTNALLYSNRAQANIFLKNYVEAVADCGESIKNDSTYVKSYFRRAKALIELNRFAEAKNDLNHALKLDPKNAECRKMLNDLTQKTTGVKPGPKKASPTSPLFAGIQTMFSSRGDNPFITQSNYDDDYDDEIAKTKTVQENYPKKINPVVKPVERRSKRPLLPIHVKVVGKKPDKKIRLDCGDPGAMNGLSPMDSFDGDSSSISSPTTTDYSNAPTPPLVSSSSPSTLSNSPSLPTLFSKLQMASVPPKPKSAAQFTKNWKQIKSNPDVCAQYLNQLETDDYLMFQDSMESSILSEILDLLVWEFLPRKWDIVRHLVGLTKIRRFSTLLMFTTEKDRANIRKLVSECPSQLQDSLKEKYEV